MGRQTAMLAETLGHEERFEGRERRIPAAGRGVDRQRDRDILRRTISANSRTGRASATWTTRARLSCGRPDWNVELPYVAEQWT